MTEEEWAREFNWAYELTHGKFVSVGEPRTKSVYDELKESVKKEVEDFEVEFTQQYPGWVRETAVRYLTSRLVLALDQYNYKWAGNVLRQIRLWNTPLDYDDNKITEEDIERIKEIPIGELMPSQPTSKSGNRWMYSSPFSEDKTPSFVWYKNNNSWFCFSNGIGGDNIALFMKMNNCGFIESCRSLLFK